MYILSLLSIITCLAYLAKPPSPTSSPSLESHASTCVTNCHMTTNLITRQPPVYRPQPLVILFHSPTLISPKLPSSHLRHCPHHSRLCHPQPKLPVHPHLTVPSPPLATTSHPHPKPSALHPRPPCPRSQVLSHPQLKLLPPPLPSLALTPSL